MKVQLAKLKEDQAKAGKKVEHKVRLVAAPR
jgi:hypothetical protein